MEGEARRPPEPQQPREQRGSGGQPYQRLTATALQELINATAPPGSSAPQDFSRRHLNTDIGWYGFVQPEIEKDYLRKSWQTRYMVDRKPFMFLAFFGIAVDILALLHHTKWLATVQDNHGSDIFLIGLMLTFGVTVISLNMKTTWSQAVQEKIMTVKFYVFPIPLPDSQNWRLEAAWGHWILSSLSRHTLRPSYVSNPEMKALKPDAQALEQTWNSLCIIIPACLTQEVLTFEGLLMRFLLFGLAGISIHNSFLHYQVALSIFFLGTAGKFWILGPRTMDLAYFTLHHFGLTVGHMILAAWFYKQEREEYLER